MSTAITTKLPIVGVGAPIHVFLPGWQSFWEPER